MEMLEKKQMKRRIIGSVLMSLLTLGAMAQISSTLSPYSQFGLGTLSDQSQGFNRAMGGLAIGLRDGRQVNMQNPASYSAIDSLTMVFDLGVSGQLTNFKEGSKKINAKTADFDYVVALFRVLPKLGMSVGIVPYSNIGYDYYNTQFVGESNTYYTTETHKGEGGFNQGFLGLGLELFRGFSLGANISYLWGDYTKSVSVVSSDTYVNTIMKSYTASVSTWKLDAGAQWQMRIGKKDVMTIGATAGIGHKLGAQADLSIVNTNSQTSVSTMTTDSVANGLSIPFTFGGGISVVHDNQLTIGADYTLQKWGDLAFPQVQESTNRYKSMHGLLTDRHKVTVGADWLPTSLSSRRKFFSLIHYRIGASYATPYYKIHGQDGPKELSVSAGFGIPILNSWNNRSTLNISAQWSHVSADNFVTENTFRINIGLTFNERWFAKWKVD